MTIAHQMSLWCWRQCIIIIIIIIIILLCCDDTKFINEVQGIIQYLKPDGDLND